MSSDELTALAKNVVSFFQGRFPDGITLEDAKQDAIVLLLEWDERMPDRAHLVTKVRGVLRDRYGKLWARHYTHPQVSMDGPVATEGAQGEGDPAADVQQAILLLPPRQRKVIVLHLRGLTQAKIGEELGYSQSYVCQLLNAAKAKLRELLEEDYG